MTTAVFKALCACFSLSPSSAEASVLIREAYQEPENAPRLPRNTDVIYFSIEPDSAAVEPPPEYTKETVSAESYKPVIAAFAAIINYRCVIRIRVNISAALISAFFRSCNCRSLSVLRRHGDQRTVIH